MSPSITTIRLMGACQPMRQNPGTGTSARVTLTAIIGSEDSFYDPVLCAKGAIVDWINCVCAPGSFSVAGRTIKGLMGVTKSRSAIYANNCKLADKTFKLLRLIRHLALRL